MANLGAALDPKTALHHPKDVITNPARATFNALATGNTQGNKPAGPPLPVIPGPTPPTPPTQFDTNASQDMWLQQQRRKSISSTIYAGAGGGSGYPSVSTGPTKTG